MLRRIPKPSRSAVVAILAVFGLAAAPQQARINTTIKVTRSTEPGRLEITATVPPHEDNRAYRIRLVCSDDHSKDLETRRQLDGLESHGPFPPSVFSSLLPCRYTVLAHLLGSGDSILAHAQPRMAVISCLNTCEDEPVESF